MVPHGFRFNPTDEELIQILDKKISVQEMPLDFIVHANVYAHEPQDLEWKETTGVSNDERYYYYKKENDSREVNGRGWWKATSHVKKVYAINNDDHHHQQPVIVGYKRPLTFHKFKNDRNRSNAVKTNWIMHEYSLESKSTEWRLCKIKYKGKPSMQEEMENTKKRFSSRLNNDFEAGSSRERQQQEPAMEAANDIGYQPAADCHWSTEEQLPQSAYDPYDLPQMGSTIASYYNFNNDQQDSQEEQPFPSLWSWQN